MKCRSNSMANKEFKTINARSDKTISQGMDYVQSRSNYGLYYSVLIIYNDRGDNHLKKGIGFP